MFLPSFFSHDKYLCVDKQRYRKGKKTERRTVGIRHIHTDFSNDQTRVYRREYGSNSYRKKREAKKQ